MIIKLNPLQERQEDLKSAIKIASKISPSERSSKAIETLEKAKSDLSSHCGDLEDKLNYRLSLDLQNQKDLEMDANIEQPTSGEASKESKWINLWIIPIFLIRTIIPSAAAYVPGSFAKKQISKLYGEKLKFHNNWEDSVSLFYSWLKKEEGSVKDKQISIGDIGAVSKAIKEAEV